MLLSRTPFGPPVPRRPIVQLLVEYDARRLCGPRVVRVPIPRQRKPQREVDELRRLARPFRRMRGFENGRNFQFAEIIPVPFFVLLFRMEHP